MAYKCKEPKGLRDKKKSIITEGQIILLIIDGQTWKLKLISYNKVILYHFMYNLR